MKTLGKGAFGKVKLARKDILDRSEKFALKVFKKTALKKKREFFRDERGSHY